METQINFRNGDVFRWSWTDEAKKNDFGAFRSYHCKSQIAVAKEGEIYDTFWHDNSSRRVDPSSVELTYLGNLNDYELVRYKKLDHYRREDILDLRHANSSGHPDLAPVYLRKGAEKCPKVMLEHIRVKMVEAQRDQASAFRDIELAREMLERVELGQLDGVWL